jgi:hypothetical protein
VFDSYSSSPSRGMEYRFVLFENFCALPATKLPPSLLAHKQEFHCIVRGTEPRIGGMDAGFF